MSPCYFQIITTLVTQYFDAEEGCFVQSSGIFSFITNNAEITGSYHFRSSA